MDEVSAAHRGPEGGMQPSDPNRPQTDLTSLLLDQFLTPIDKDVTAAASSSDAAAASQLNTSILSQTSQIVSETVKNLNETSAASSSDYGNRSRLVRASFATKNVQYMHRCSAGDALIDLCANQPHLSSFIRQWNGAASGEGISCVPASLSEATAAKQTFPALVQEVGTSWRALTIPVLEPLTADRIARVCEVVMGCLLASVSVATTQSILSVQQNNPGTACSGGAGSSTVGTISRYC